MSFAGIVARVAGVVLMATGMEATAARPGAPDWLPSPNLYATPTSNSISCANTPFGNAVPVVRDYEAMLLLWGSSAKYIDEYRPSEGAETPPLQRVYRSSLATTRTLRRAVNVDLNGDGRDEVVELLSDGADVQLAVYERAQPPSAASAQVISTWVGNLPVVVDSLNIVAGDLDGSKDRQQEIAVSFVVAGGGDAGKVYVAVFQGDGAAHLAQPSGYVAALFATTSASLLFPRLAVGDFLAQGRDQLVLVSYDQGSGNENLDLLEFDSGTHVESITAALPSLGNAMRGAHFALAFAAGSAPASQFIYDNDPVCSGDSTNFSCTTTALTEDVTYSTMQLNGSSKPVIESLEANGGDVVDTAADELAVHLMFYDPVIARHVLAQRLQHFSTTRDANNVITSIALAHASGVNLGDSSSKIATYPSAPPRFAVTLADVDAIAHKEIVTAVAGHDGNNGLLLGPMTWTARKAYVRNQPDFTWQNLGLSNNKPLVAFRSTSQGEIVAYEWNLCCNDDGSAVSPERNPLYAFPGVGNYIVRLMTTDSRGIKAIASAQITVTGTADATPNATFSPPEWTYRIDADAAFDGTSNPDYQYHTYGSDNTVVRVAAGDMNHDGLPEVVVAASDDGIEVDTHVFKRQANGSFARTTYSTFDSVTGMDLVLSDFDGDSLNAVLTDVAGDCRSVIDASVSSLTWMPPYFSRPQANLRRFAAYGRSSSTSSSTEEHSESYWSNSLTLAIGIDYELEAPVLAIKLAEVEAKVKVGAEYQIATGETHGTEVAYSLDEGYSVGNDTPSGDQEGLLVVRSGNSDCYSYNLATSAGVVPNSMMRSCKAKPAQSPNTGTGAKDWNLGGTDAIPVHWVPMQRDWASLALFHVPIAGSNPATPIAFTAGHGPDKATDGLFDTAAESSSAVDKPYLDIDLGFVRDIQSIRVFPSASGAPTPSQPLDFKNAVPDLWGFRLYASTTPFSGSALPTADAATTFNPGGISTLVQDTGVEAVYRYWNVWTLHGGEPLRARYLRLQKPGSGSIRISEVQVFGDTHSEPQFYPEAVCDPVAGDGVFKAYVFDTVNRLYKVIQVRGDMAWTGTVDIVSNVLQPTGVPSCVNDAANGIRQGPIWQNTYINGSAESAWNLSADTTKTDSFSRSNEWSAHVGAELEAKFGAGVTIVAGAEYESSSGISRENQSGTSYGSGFQVGGEIGGFTPLYFNTCGYHPRPYNYVVKEYSDAGFLHQMSVTDYVVRQKFFAPNAWQREAVPALCSDNSADDGIFIDGFDGA